MKVEILFPEICNLCGDGMNMRYRGQCCPEREFIETDIKSRPRFLDEDIALVYLGSTTEKGLAMIANALATLKDAIAAKIDAGQLFLATGNAVDVLTEAIESDQADTIEGLGLLQGKARYKMMQRHNSFFLGSFEDMEIVGFKSLFGHVHESGEAAPLFTCVRGVGRDGTEGTADGFRRGGLLATHLIGPLLVLNPPLCKWLLRQMGAPDNLAFEAAAFAAYEQRLKEFKEPDRPWKY